MLQKKKTTLVQRPNQTWKLLKRPLKGDLFNSKILDKLTKTQFNPEVNFFTGIFQIFFLDFLEILMTYVKNSKFALFQNTLNGYSIPGTPFFMLWLDTTK